MQKLYTKNTNREQLFLLVVAGLFLFGTFLFHPTLGLWKQYQNRQRLEDFFDIVHQSNFTMRQYWEFREFYSRGSFSFDPETVSLAGALQFNTIKEPKAILLAFHSAKLDSTDSIMNTRDAQEFFAKSTAQDNHSTMILQLADRAIYKTDDQKIHLLFLRSTDEMVKTLGLFDYGKKEKEILGSKLWLNETTVSPQ